MRRSTFAALSSAMAAYYNSDAPARAARLLKLVTLVASRRSGQRIGREQLARACACTVKTIQRDIQCLQEAQIPLHYDPEARTYTLPARGWSFPDPRMSATDAMALALARGFLINSPIQPPYAQEITAALDHATEGLTPELRALFESVTQVFQDSGSLGRDYSQVTLGPLLESLARRETIEFEYESRSSQTKERRRVDPYRLDRRDGRYFELQAWCHARQAVRTFALDRIREIALTGEPFRVRAWDDADEGVVSGLRSGSLIPIEVRFSAQVAAYARERAWGFTATFEDCNDGACILRGQVRGADGVVNELLRWNHHAEVLGGPELRERMVREVRAMAGMYAEPANK